MLANKFRTQKSNPTLINQLRQFGLNPNDWRLLPAGQNCYKIQSHSDENWFFIGTTKNRNREWQHMQLASL